MRAVGGLRISRKRFKATIRELALRGGGVRESGVFLLSRQPDRSPAVVDDVVFYDDLDPDCLTGGISFSSRGFGALNALCRQRGLVVVGDMHTHPRDWVEQSDIDAANPMSEFRGHIAVIVPNYAAGRIRPTQCGVHRYLGDRKWQSYVGRDAQRLLEIPPWWRGWFRFGKKGDADAQH